MPDENKMTILPLHYCDWRLKVPARIDADLTVENVDGFLRPELFDLWRDFLSKKDRDDLASTEIGLVHRFRSEQFLVSKPEVDSTDRAYKAFLLLRLIRPTRARYSHVQMAVRGGQPDVFAFAEPDPGIPNTPNLETFNKINNESIKQLAEFLPKFVRFADSAPRYLTRAVRFFETGYSRIPDPLLQFITWTTAIESFFSEDQGPLSDKELIHRIAEQIDTETNIYSETDIEALADTPKPIPVKDLLRDILDTRNLVIHGIRVPASFDERVIMSAATGEKIHYVDVLREGASFVLRKLILKAIREIDA